ncbi:MAG: hypothetical protein LBK08_04520 [Treponema sp.]|nr:hypothetical protein [Treponema sp.]
MVNTGIVRSVREGLWLNSELPFCLQDWLKAEITVGTKLDIPLVQIFRTGYTISMLLTTVSIQADFRPQAIMGAVLALSSTR